MQLKKKIMMLTAGAVLSTSLLSGVASADTVKIKKGDTLWGLSIQNNTSVQAIKDLNNLTSNTIYIGQTIIVSADSDTTTSTTSTNNDISYIVKRGDTLSAIGVKYKVSYHKIKAWNNLSSNTIYPGQKLSINGSSVEDTVIENKTPEPINVQSSSNQRNELTSFAKKFLGTPYVWGGSSPSGFDCSGFIYYTLKSQGLVKSRTNTAGYWSQSAKISNPQVGDLIFFQNTYTYGPSHMGIYLGNGDFIHAGMDGISIDNVNSSYWKKHFLGYGTFY
jgi:peptidoglycan DL-endopeptidase LytE